MVFPTIVFSRPHVNNTLLCTELFSSFISLNVGLELLSKAPVRTDCLKLKADYPDCRKPLRLVSAGSHTVSASRPSPLILAPPVALFQSWSHRSWKCSSSSATVCNPSFHSARAKRKSLSCHLNNHPDNILTFSKANSF